MNDVELAIKIESDIDELIIIAFITGMSMNEFLNSANQYLKSIPELDSKLYKSIYDDTVKTYQKVLKNEVINLSSEDLNLKNVYVKGVIEKLPKSVYNKYVTVADAVNELLANNDWTYEQAVRKIINSNKFKGLKVHSNGRNYRLTPLVKRLVRDYMREVHNNATKDVAFQKDPNSIDLASGIDSNVYEVSAHAGARYLCSLYQGKLISDTQTVAVDLNGNEHSVVLTSDIDGYKGAGLFGYNCRHIKWLWLNGLSTREFDKLAKRIEKQENALEKLGKFERYKPLQKQMEWAINNNNFKYVWK